MLDCCGDHALTLRAASRRCTLDVMSSNSLSFSRKPHSSCPRSSICSQAWMTQRSSAWCDFYWLSPFGSNAWFGLECAVIGYRSCHCRWLNVNHNFFSSLKYHTRPAHMHDQLYQLFHGWDIGTFLIDSACTHAISGLTYFPLWR